MMMIIMMVLLLMFGGVLGSAQSGGATLNCNGLDEVDCTLLRETADTMRTVTSFEMPAWAVDARLVSADEGITLRANGTGTAVLPATLTGIFQDVPGVMSITDLSPIIDVLNQLDADVIEATLTETGLHLVLESGELSIPDTADLAGEAQLLVKDAGLFLQLPSPNGAVAWFGEDLALDANARSELDTMLSEALSALESDDAKALVAQLSEVSGTLGELQELLNDSVITERLDDDTLQGEAMAVFVSEFDLLRLLSDPDLGTLLYRMLENPVVADLMSDMDLGLGDMELDDLSEQDVRFLLVSLGLLIEDSNFTLTQWVGLDDGYVHGFIYDFNLALDLSILGDESMQSVEIALMFDVMLDEFNMASLDGIKTPELAGSLDDIENFAPGGPDLIEGQLELGTVHTDSITSDGDGQDFFALELKAGDTVTLAAETDGYVYVTVYGPDGFEIDSTNSYDEALTITAKQSGVYLVEAQGYGDFDYDLRVDG